jgi:putative ribosome biogenesis GTPase RsgA
MKLSTTEMETILALVGKADYDQSNEIASRVQLQRTFLANQKVRSFVVGDNVKFTSRSKMVETGVISKVNRRYIHVQVGHMNWKVPAEMLSAA